MGFCNIDTCKGWREGDSLRIYLLGIYMDREIEYLDQGNERRIKAREENGSTHSPMRLGNAIRKLSEQANETKKKASKREA